MIERAHLILGDDTFEVSLLFGADYCWNTVQVKIVTGNGPTGGEGRLLAGPIASTKITLTNISITNAMVSHKVEEFDLDTFLKSYQSSKIGILSSYHGERITQLYW